jgi:hypothetical protein
VSPTPDAGGYGAVGVHRPRKSFENNGKIKGGFGTTIENRDETGGSGFMVRNKDAVKDAEWWRLRTPTPNPAVTAA